MASLSELYSVAKANQNDQANNFDANASGVLSFLGGYQGGVKQKQANETAALDRALKLIDIHEKMAKVDEMQTNNLIKQNVMKGYGILPLNPAEKDNARSLASIALGQSDSTVLSNDKSNFGKIAKLSYDLSNNYDMIPDIPGLKFNKKKSDSAAGERAEKNAIASRQTKIMTLAKKAAEQETLATMRAQGKIYNPVMDGPIPIASGSEEKYLNAMTKYIAGDVAGYRADMDKIRQSLPVPTPDIPEDEISKALNDLLPK